MSLRRFSSVVVSIALAASSLLAQAPAPRKSPELSITKPSGDDLLLSSFKGKVVVMEFMFVASSHCLQLAEMLNKLQADLGPRGFQAVDVEFGPNSDIAMVGHVVERLHLTYPVGKISSENVDAYLGRQVSEQLKITQFIVISRKFFIRSTTGTGNPTLE